jgi:hypothetical protein
MNRSPTSNFRTPHRIILHFENRFETGISFEGIGRFDNLSRII